MFLHCETCNGVGGRSASAPLKFFI